MQENNSLGKNLEINISYSRKWSAREAGIEVAKKSIKGMNHPPCFVLVFSTIHYKNNGGFKEFLKGIWGVLPKGTPLIGGTIAGFITNDGCFSRGAAALAIYCQDMDVAIGIGKHTKRNPKIAGNKCASMIKEKLDKSTNKNKVLINVISGPKQPDLPGMGPINVTKSKTFSFLFSTIGLRVFPFFGYSIGKEEDVLSEMSEMLPDYFFMGCTSADDGKFISDYQFFGENVFSNSIVALGFTVDESIEIDTEIGLHPTNKTFDITKTSFSGRLITKIENKPAKDYLYRSALNLSPEQIKELGAFYYKLSYHFPMTFEEDLNHTSGVGAVIGNGLLMGHRIKGVHGRLLSVTGKEAVNNVDNLFPNDTKSLPFVFMFSSAIYNFILGHKTFDIKDKLDEKLGSKPYLMVQPMIENIKLPYKEPYIRVYSLNTLSIKDDAHPEVIL